MNFKLLRLFVGLTVGIVAFTLFLLWANTSRAELYPAAKPFGNISYMVLVTTTPKSSPPAPVQWIPIKWSPPMWSVPLPPTRPTQNGINAHDLY